MDGYESEQEQLEAIKKWWRENGKSAVFGVVLGLGGIFGWRAWQSHMIEQAEAASEAYQAALVAQGQGQYEEARQGAMEILNNYGDTGYALFARLLLAYNDAMDGNYSAAEAQLQAALDETDEAAIRNEIQLRLVRVYIANGKLDQALSILNSAQPGEFASQYNELKGDIYVIQGRNDEARLAYQQALEESSESAFDPSLLNLKLNSLD